MENDLECQISVSFLFHLSENKKFTRIFMKLKIGESFSQLWRNLIKIKVITIFAFIQNNWGTTFFKSNIYLLIVFVYQNTKKLINETLTMAMIPSHSDAPSNLFNFLINFSMSKITLSINYCCVLRIIDGTHHDVSMCVNLFVENTESLVDAAVEDVVQLSVLENT